MPVTHLGPLCTQCGKEPAIQDGIGHRCHAAMANLLDPIYEDENDAGRRYIDRLRIVLDA